MIVALILFLILSLTVNGIFIWYTRKLIKNLNVGIDGVTQFQELLEQYAENLTSMFELEQYYGDETVAAAIKNTKMVIEASKFYKKSIIGEEEETSIDQQQ